MARTTWDHEFIDKTGQKITFDVLEESITAYHDGKQIGQFTLKVIEMDERFPPEIHADVIDVDEKFRKAGIGSEMVRLAFEQHGYAIIPPPTYEAEAAKRNSITEDGMRLLLSGQKKGWFTDFPDQTDE
jgi:GNAT superfamily N-acetyltransferase